ncbi:MAG: outer membrane protein assembly factor BamD [Bacteroidales bacterium]|nr:outer membrane protein assembly factor BamD [Bacteroidales bacterium]
MTEYKAINNNNHSGRMTKKDIRRACAKAMAFVAFAVILLTGTGCSEYQMLMKTRDSALWYAKGIEYYNRGEYLKAANLLGGVITAYTGTSRADTVTLYYANSLVKIEDYVTAGHYYQSFVKMFPSSDECERCQFMSGFCHYKMSPQVELDQTDTETSIEEFQTYMDLYPNGDRVEEAARMMKEMQDKMAYKAYLSAKLYFDLGNYMGNNYNSAVITAENCLKKYPDTKHREELAFLILEAKFIQAEQSVLEKQSERYRETIDEYYAFANEYPQSRYTKKAKNILEDSEKGLKKAEKLAPPSEDDLNYYKNYGNETERRMYEE